MAKRSYMFTFPPELAGQLIIYNFGIQFKLITNIRRANIAEAQSWVILEVDGEEDDIDEGIAWVISKGVRVAPVIEEGGK
jgi:hypothetical protein